MDVGSEGGRIHRLSRSGHMIRDLCPESPGRPNLVVDTFLCSYFELIRCPLHPWYIHARFVQPSDIVQQERNVVIQMFISPTTP